MSERKFYILKRLDDPGYGEAAGFVVRAWTSQAARKFASRASGDEGGAVWLEHLRTSCDEIHENGPVGVVLRSFKSSYSVEVSPLPHESGRH